MITGLPLIDGFLYILIGLIAVCVAIAYLYFGSAFLVKQFGMYPEWTSNFLIGIPIVIICLWVIGYYITKGITS